MQTTTLDSYIQLISQFVEGRMGAEAFERSYLRLFKNDPTHWPEDIFTVLDVLFFDVDAYCGNVELRGERDIDEHELRTRSRTALSKLQSLSEREGAEA